MTRIEAQSILALYRPGVDDAGDPLFAEALAMAARDPELSRWLANEQKADIIIADKLAETVEVPFGLKNVLLALPTSGSSAPKTRSTFTYALSWALPILLLFVSGLLFISSLKNSATPDQFRSEMLGFVRLPPALELKTHSLNEIQDWLHSSGNLAPLLIPTKTQAQSPVGCRTLMFRDQKVALVCFLRENHQLIHLLAVNRAAFPHTNLPATPEWKREGEWMTALWRDGDTVYLLTTKGDRADLEQYL